MNKTKCRHCDYPNIVYSNDSGHAPSCPVHIAYLATNIMKNTDMLVTSCPVCESNNTDDYDMMEEDGEGNVYHRRKCYECGSIWQINYKFHSVSDIINGKEIYEK